MRFLLDVRNFFNIEESSLEQSFSRLVGLARANHHRLLVHPASEDEIIRDWNAERRRQNLESLQQYARLEDRVRCPWNSPYTRPNDALNNELLYALHCEAAHALITEDRGLHSKARDLGLSHRVHSIQTAEDWLLRLHEPRRTEWPAIEDVSLEELAFQPGCASGPQAGKSRPASFEGLIAQSPNGGRAWVVRDASGAPVAVCVYSIHPDSIVTKEGGELTGQALVLSAFEIAPSARSRRIGELFLNSAFRYATANRLESIVVYGDADRHPCLFAMLEDFGFLRVGAGGGSGGREVIYCKQHPVFPPDDAIEPLDYMRRFYPHFRHDQHVNKFIIAIRPSHHAILFPDYSPPSGRQLTLFSQITGRSNAIRLACLCHSRTGRIQAGDVVLFYRSGDEHAVTSVGVAESCEALTDAGMMAASMKRRTAYSMREIEELAGEPTKVVLFRFVKHFAQPLSKSWLEAHGILKRLPRTITKISQEAFELILRQADRAI